MRSHIENSMLWKQKSGMFYANIVNIKRSRETLLTSWQATLTLECVSYCSGQGGTQGHIQSIIHTNFCFSRSYYASRESHETQLNIIDHCAIIQSWNQEKGKIRNTEINTKLLTTRHLYNECHEVVFQLEQKDNKVEHWLTSHCKTQVNINANTINQ